MPRLILNPLHGTFDFVNVDGEGSEFGVVLVGTINGSNLVFTTPDEFVHATLRVFYNGVRVHEPEDYAASESGGPGTGFDTVTFVAGFAPKTGDRLLADYTKSV